MLPRAIVSILTASMTVLTLVLGACGVIPPQKQTPVIEYDYSKPVPESDLIAEEWFDDSCVIGHSLMEGFAAFGGIYSNIHYFTSTGLTASNALSYSKFELPDGGTGTLEQGLDQREFSKYYIMLGINEVSSSNTSYEKSVKDIIDTLRDRQKDAPIYVLSITPTTKEKSDGSPYNKDNIVRLNAVLQKLCEKEKCYYVDLYDCFADGQGYLPADKSTDGVHLTVSQYKVMATYLQSHTVAEAS